MLKHDFYIDDRCHFVCKNIDMVANKRKLGLLAIVLRSKPTMCNYIVSLLIPNRRDVMASNP